MPLIKISTLNNIRVVFFLSAVFLLPQAYYYRIYFAFVLFLSLLSFTNTSFRFDGFVKLVVGTVSFVTLSTLIRFVFLVEPNVKDLTEVGRLLLPCIILVNSETLKKFSFTHLANALLIVTAVDFAITMMEFLLVYSINTPAYIFMQNNYWGEIHHASYSRSKGLFPGPGQHAVFASLAFIIYLMKFLSPTGNKKLLWIVATLATLFCAVATLSRTAVIGIIFGILLAFFLQFRDLTKKNFVRLGYFTTILLVGGFYYISAYADRLVRIFEIAESGLGNASFQARGDMWRILLDIAFERSEFILTGWGKEYFGVHAAATDNEYVFIFAFYGLIVFIVFILMLLFSLAEFLLSRRVKSDAENTMFILILLGLVFAIPSVFFFYVPNLVLFTILSIVIYHEGKQRNLVDAQRD